MKLHEYIDELKRLEVAASGMGFGYNEIEMESYAAWPELKVIVTKDKAFVRINVPRDKAKEESDKRNAGFQNSMNPR